MNLLALTRRYQQIVPGSYRFFSDNQFSIKMPGSITLDVGWMETAMKFLPIVKFSQACNTRYGIVLR